MKKIPTCIATLSLLLFLGTTTYLHSRNQGPIPDNFQLQKLEEANRTSRSTVKIALLLDTSNSMDGLINQAKAQLWDIVNQFTHARCSDDRRPSLQIALYQYGNDDLSAREGYIQQVIGFTSDLDELSEKLFSLRTNGGEEFCGQVIHTSLGQLDWGRHPEDLKMIFIAGNEPFSQGKLDYRDAVANAMEKEVIINTIYCGNYEQGVATHWKHGADLSGGDYMAIDHNQAVVYIATPYDDVIIRLNSRLNATYVSYGPQGAGKQQQQATQDANAMEMETAVAVKRAVAKSSSFYANPSWDLVDASQEEGFDLTKLKKEQLPEELRSKNKEELQQYIRERKKERVALQQQIKELNAKRDAFIAEKKQDESGELQSAMLEAIRRQASGKNFHWE